MVDISLESNVDINKTNNSGLFLLLSKINNKIPSVVKLFFFVFLKIIILYYISIKIIRL
jgi:hypothetical protein